MEWRNRTENVSATELFKTCLLYTSYEEELTYLDSEISKTEETLKALKTRKKELAKVKEQADLQTLYAAIKESGKSVADVISSLK